MSQTWPQVDDPMVHIWVKHFAACYRFLEWPYLSHSWCRASLASSQIVGMSSSSDDELSLPSRSSQDMDRELYQSAVDNIFSVRADLGAAARRFRTFSYWLDRYFDAWVRAFFFRVASLRGATRCGWSALLCGSAWLTLIRAPMRSIPRLYSVPRPSYLSLGCTTGSP